eukprot:scaffold6311_cov18-Prasinocladus_malaysianus.AAC.1
MVMPFSFRRKCLVLAVLETDGRTKATAVLGRVVIDLAQYAGFSFEECKYPNLGGRHGAQTNAGCYA